MENMSSNASPEGRLNVGSLSRNDSEGAVEPLRAEDIELEGQEDPKGWKPLPKWLYTVLVVLISGIVGFSSSVQTPALPAIAKTFNVSSLVSNLGSTLYLIGSAFGPLILAPLSEQWGRNPLYYSAYLMFCLSTLGQALAPNFAAFLVFRFLAGFMGLAAVANAGGSITDLWPQAHRSVPFALFTAASFCGPVLGPIMGGFLTQYTNWRWNFWFVFIVAAVIYVAMALFLPETYPTTLRERKAKKMGIPVTRDAGVKSFGRGLLRPWLMLFTEPILFTVSLYMAFIYGVLFLDFTAYPGVYQKTRGWSVSISGLSFLGIGVGMAIATAGSPQVNRLYGRWVQKIGPVPEARLPHIILIAWLLPAGLFWFAWTALPPTAWIWSIIAGLPFGFALVMLFLAINGYLTDCYDRYAASALAANTMLRCLFGAGFALFANDMYEEMGTPWATTLLGFVASALAILPWLLYKYGAKLRAASKFHVRVSVTTSPEHASGMKQESKMQTGV